MSTFKVNLKTLVQGTLDVWSTTSATPVGAAPGVSLQRQCYVAGPKRVNRLMVDGETFSDCNYWKRFCPVSSTNPGGCDPVAAFLLCTYDDGAPYSDVPSEQTFAVDNGAGVAAGVSPLWTTAFDFATTYGSYATSAIITNTGATVATIRINGSGSFTLAAGATQVFNTGDLVITTIEGKSAAGGNLITVFAGVKSVSNS